MLDKKKPRDDAHDRGVVWTIFHGQIPEWGIKLLEIILIVASLFLAIRSLVEVVREDIWEWSNPTVIASLLVATLSVSLYLDARFPGGSGVAMTKRLLILGVAVAVCCKLAYSY